MSGQIILYIVGEPTHYPTKHLISKPISWFFYYADFQGFNLVGCASSLMERVLRPFRCGIHATDMPAYYMYAGGKRRPRSRASSRREHGDLSFIYDAKIMFQDLIFQIFSWVFREIPFWFRSFPFSFPSFERITRSIYATKSGIIRTFTLDDVAVAKRL